MRTPGFKLNTWQAPAGIPEVRYPLCLQHIPFWRLWPQECMFQGIGPQRKTCGIRTNKGFFQEIFYDNGNV
jgi:hypothetical protein